MSTTTAERVVSQSRPSLSPERLRRYLSRAVLYVFITALAGVLIVPLFWLVSSSLKEGSHIFDQPVQWFPAVPQWKNYPDAWNALPFTRFFFNTLFVTLLPVMAEILVSAIVAYGFARFEFPGRNILFMVMLST